MMEFLTANMAPVMFGSLIIFLLFGYSVAFSLAACGLFFGFVGICVFLLPFVVVVIELSMPLVIKAYTSNEMSSNAGGLIRWPVFALLPLGFVFLGLQGLSELIKRLAFLKGLVPDPTQKVQGKTAEEELAEFLLQKEVVARDAALLSGSKTAGAKK